MVYGIEKFKEYFEEYTGQYVFIGGTACSILLDDIGEDFRATKDLDIVLLIEEIDENFGEVFWDFIKEGEYQHIQKSTGKDQFYRFEKPKRNDFPFMIELFSRKSDKFSLRFESELIPIHLSEDIQSLSAILLNDDYYEILVKGKSVVDGYSVLGIECILLFKMKAWMDLLERKENGERIDSKNIKKHKNDIFRLLAYVNPDSSIIVNDEVKKDIEVFLDKIPNESIDLTNLGLRNYKLDHLLDMIRKIYKKSIY